MIQDAKLRGELAMLDAEVRALEITNWRFLLSDEAQRANPSFASVLKLKGVELQQEITGLLALLSCPVGLEKKPADGPGAEHWSAPLVQRYMYLRAASIYGGSSEVQKDILARHILG